MSEKALISELERYLHTERDRLRTVHDLESEIAALQSANERLHAQVRALQAFPLMGAAQRLNARLNEYPAVKAVLKRVVKKLK